MVSRIVVIGVQFNRGRFSLASTFLRTVLLRKVGGGAGGTGTDGAPSDGKTQRQTFHRLINM